MTPVIETAERLRGEAERLRDEFGERIGPEVSAAAERASEEAARLRRDRLEPTVERIRERAPEYAEQVASYVEERVDEDTLRTWGPRLLFALIGFVVGFLLGRALEARRDGAAERWDDAGLAQAPASDVDRLRREARPPTRMPTRPEAAEAGTDGERGS